jgi:hypothetical protein
VHHATFFDSSLWPGSKELKWSAIKFFIFPMAEIDFLCAAGLSLIMTPVALGYDS